MTYVKRAVHKLPYFSKCKMNVRPIDISRENQAKITFFIIRFFRAYLLAV
jgi:hypothetical protein